MCQSGKRLWSATLPIDLEMAQNIAMPRVGVSYGVHSVEVLQRYQPLTIAHDVPSLHEFLVQQYRLHLAALPP